MRRRGRPKHPDILTPREWEVLALLRDRLANPEIAERLGITRDAVKYHVSEILSKLGVSSREEAALWHPSERPWWAAAVAAVGAAVSRFSLVAKAIAIGASLAVLAGLALLAYGVLRSGDGQDESRTDSASTAPATSPAEVQTEGGTPLVSGSEMPLPESYALLVVTGCFQCDGPNTGIARVYKLGGSVVSQVILDPTKLGFGPRPEAIRKSPGGTREGEPYVGGVVATADASEIWVSICVRERCGIGGMDATTPGSQTAIVRSTDGGVTWSEIGRVDLGGGDVLTTAGPGRVIVRLQEGDSSVFAYFPGLERITPPEPRLSPLAFVDGRIVWRSFENGRVWIGNDLLKDFGDSARATYAFEVFAQPRPDIGLALQTAAGSELDVVDLSGNLISSFDYDRLSLPHVDLGKGLMLGNADIDPSRLTQPLPQESCTWLPVMLNLSGGEIRPIVDGFTAPPLACGRNDAIAVQRGPFLRVANTGSCLNVRESPDPAAQAVECIADGALVLDLASASRLVSGTPINGGGWLEVRTPSGNHGYASAQYLER